ncbi:MAG: 4-hydroxythreonine-4-phosphate dehydrogenase PdxA, partial [Spirochaetales bacterium]|nr:4-hydroxythreonine-4-phosphate dehydrogenase PdxA [Spirochaetales bacterium]
TNTDINICRIEKTEDYKDNHLNIFPIDNPDFADLRIGEVSAMCGKAAYEYIEKSIDLAMKKQVAAVATPPINKESLKAANIPYIGHTEIFGALTNTADPLTMFEVRNLRIFFLTRHVSLRNACDLITKERIEDYVKRCIDVLNKLGVTDGTMAIAGLNPHSGEHGLFGNEEVDEITPAVENLKALGYEVDGPISADSVFHLALQGRYNSVLSLYHDQGHIAAKTFDFERTISVTGGMPILRTSVDHGTAMDIAGTGKASEISMKEAIKVAVKYCKSYI